MASALHSARPGGRHASDGRVSCADAALRVLRAEGVGVDAIQRGGERMGIYFVEAGASQRPWSIAYDRAHSAISELDPSSLDWPELLRDVAWFHTSGITPALGRGPAESTRRAVQAARELGVTVSLDFNYRRTLWSAAAAKEVLPSLVRYVDVLFAGELIHTATVLAESDTRGARKRGDGARAGVPAPPP